MPDLSPLTALGETAPATETIGALTLTEVTGTALASLAIGRGATPPQPFGLTLPGPGAWAEGDVSAIWTGPDQWLLEAPGRAEDDLASELAAATGAAVTDQTDAWVIFDISAAEAEVLDGLLELLVNLDPASVGPGCAVPTLLHHQRVVLVRRAEGRLSVFGTRSAAGSLWHALTRASRLGQLEGGVMPIRGS